MSNIISTILNANNDFSQDYLEIINRAFAKATRTTGELLQDLPDIDILFYANSGQVIEQTGIGGNTENANTIIIPLDPKFNISEQELFLTICHEIHHAKRIAALGDTDSLLKKVISEGLADQFQVQINPNTRPVTYRNDISSDELEKALQELKEIANNDSGYDYYEWFFGYGKYSNWIGYTLGNMIIERFVNEENQSPSELVLRPVDYFSTFVNKFQLK